MTAAAADAVTVAAARAAALFTAAKKSGRAWIGSRLVWCAWHDDAIVLVTGGPEQAVEIPTTVEVTLADSTGAAALRLTMKAEVLNPGTPEWDGAARLLAERRLNGVGQPAEFVTRWSTESRVTRLTIVEAELR